MSKLLVQFRAEGQRRLDIVQSKEWPATSYQSDILGFVRDRIHLDPAPEAEQPEILQAAARPRSRVAVAAGQKIGKTFDIAALAWWHFCCFRPSKTVFTATTKKQGDNTIWDEIRKFRHAALAKGTDLLSGGSTLAEDPETGVESQDRSRSIRGLSVREIEAAGGISGENLLFLADEASALDQKFLEALFGNMAGGGRIWLSGNTLRSEGPFFDCFHQFKGEWTRFQISSLDVARRFKASGRQVPGMAREEDVLSNIEKFGGMGSIFAQTRVLARFVEVETGKVVGLISITKSHEAWSRQDASYYRDRPLRIGVDPAGPGIDSDGWGFAATKGLRLLAPIELLKGMTIDDGLAHTYQLLGTFRGDTESETLTPEVLVDIEGEWGTEFAGKLRLESQRREIQSPATRFKVIGVKSSNRPTPKPSGSFYDTVRDELWACLGAWYRDGGQTPEDFLLDAEVHFPSWEILPKTLLAKVTPKKHFRKELGRSPGRADALALSVYRPENAIPPPGAGTGASPGDPLGGINPRPPPQDPGSPWWEEPPTPQDSGSWDPFSGQGG